MQAVILAAGRGTRMRELTESTPKSMLTVLGKPILAYTIEALPQEIDEVIIVVGYLGSVIHEYFGGSYDNRRILYVEQDNPVGGTADALWQAKDILKDTFLATNGDDLYQAADLQKMIGVKDWAMLVSYRDQIGAGGKVVFDKSKRIESIQEGTHEGGGYVNAGAYTLDQRFFTYAPVPKSVDSLEKGLPQTMLSAAQDISIQAVEASHVIALTTPEDIQKAEIALRLG